VLEVAHEGDAREQLKGEQVSVCCFELVDQVFGVPVRAANQDERTEQRREAADEPGQHNAERGRRLIKIGAVAM
jgi:hypothetical protein